MKLISILLLTLSISTNVHAYEDEESMMNFDEIVSQLSKSKTNYNRPTANNDPFANVLIHGGVSFISASISMGGYGIEEMSAFHKGVEASLGIDLFSKNWAAEGAVRSFGAQKSNDIEYSLKEFDIRILYRDDLTYKTKWKVGFGVSARYLDIKSNTKKDSDEVIIMNSSIDQIETTYTTPASIMSLGIEGYVADGLSMGVDVAYRKSMIEETADLGSLEAIFKLEGHF